MDLLTVNGKDLTRYIDKDTYQVNAEDVYESWLNANFVERRIIVRQRVKGSFTIKCGNGLTYASFLSTWMGAVDNGVVTLGVFVQSNNKFEAIEAYYKFEGSRHVEHSNGAVYDEVTVTIEEC